jgi:hypothetical protein
LVRKIRKRAWPLLLRSVPGIGQGSRASVAG